LTHRVVTVTGQAVARPGNFEVPIGTAVGELLDFCGGVTEKAAKVVLGGPMMGIAIADLATPVTKTTNAITVLTGRQIGRAKYERRETPCIRCGRCIEACPSTSIHADRPRGQDQRLGRSPGELHHGLHRVRLL